jgi:hypothetical protein
VHAGRQREDAAHGLGLARAWAPRDDAELAAQGRQAGHVLPVDFIAPGFKDFGQQVRWNGFGRRGGQAQDCTRQRLFVTEEAGKIQSLPVEDERQPGTGRADHPRVQAAVQSVQAQGGQPLTHVRVAKVQADVPLAHGQGNKGRQAGHEVGMPFPGQGRGEAGLVEVGLGEEGARCKAGQDGGL